MPGLFITGTDTGVGKTIITAGIASFLLKNGIDCAVMKPIESGCTRGAPESDAHYLKTITETQEPLQQINVYTFKAPLAPGIAASREKRSISFSKIAQAYQKMQKRHPWVLVEGAGGLMVPLSQNKNITDLIGYLDLKVLLVGRLGLGTLNHTLLSLEYLQKRKIPVVGVVLNSTQTHEDESAKSNLKTLAQWTQTPIWGQVGYIYDRQKKSALIKKIAEGIGQAALRFFK